MMYTYFVRSGDRIKIGISKNVDGRIRDLQTAHGATLALLGVISGNVEADWHRRFSSLRLLGEWFQLAEPLNEALRDAFGVKIEKIPTRECVHPVRMVKPIIELQDLWIDLELRVKTGIRHPDRLVVEDWLYGNLSADELEHEIGEKDTAVVQVLQLLEKYDKAWVGWAGIVDKWYDLWLIFWAPAGVESRRVFRSELLRLAVHSGVWEMLRLRPILLHRREAPELPESERSDLIEELNLSLLYSDETAALVMAGSI